MQIQCMAVAAFCNSIQGQKIRLAKLHPYTGKLHWDVALLLVANNREMKHALKRRDHQSNGILLHILCISVLPALTGV